MSNAALDSKASILAADLRGVLLPLQGSSLLLPNVTVAEVIGNRETEQVANAPDWLTGSLTWRQRKVPVVSFEYFLSKEIKDPGYRARIALCHNLSGNQRVPFIGMLCTSIPKLARVNNETLNEDESMNSLPQMTLKHAFYLEEEVWVPDLEALGEAAAGYLFKE